MKLRGIEFGSVFNAAGARNFFGEGYWFHRVWRPLGLRYTGSTFVAKTTTLEPRNGNMPTMPDGITPKEWIPKCIYVDALKGIVLNAVGLTGPGAKNLLEDGPWQRQSEPFCISFMSVGSTPGERRDDLIAFVRLLGPYLPHMKAPMALQINFSCPNVGLETDALITEVSTALNHASALQIPLIPKFSATVPTASVREISQHQNCDAICVSNTIPFGLLPERIDWEKLFGSCSSPLRARGINADGGLSGTPLLPIVCDWIRNAKLSDIEIPIIGCGGIVTCFGAVQMFQAGAAAVELGSVSILRPWSVRSIILTARRVAPALTQS